MGLCPCKQGPLSSGWKPPSGSKSSAAFPSEPASFPSVLHLPVHTPALPPPQKRHFFLPHPYQVMWTPEPELASVIRRKPLSRSWRTPHSTSLFPSPSQPWPGRKLAQLLFLYLHQGQDSASALIFSQQQSSDLGVPQALNPAPNRGLASDLD